MNRLLNKNKYLTGVVLFVGFLIPVFVKAAEGGSFFGDIASTVVTKGAFYINYAIGWIAGLVFAAAASLLDWILELTNNMLIPAGQPGGNYFLYTGWKILVNFADLGLVLALIVIAFATILNRQSYGMKKTLWKLIVAALLVNFSLVIPGIMIDVSGFVTQFFIDQSTRGGASSMATTLAGAFNVQRFLETKEAGQVDSSLAKFTSGSLVAVGSIFFTVIFTILSALVLFAFVVMFFIRFFVLNILLIVSPIVLVMWIFPFTKKNWDKWWNTFLRWTFFAPIVTFFLFLSVTFIQMQTSFNNQAQPMDQIQAAAEGLSTNLTFPVGAIVNSVLAIGMLIGSLFIANSFSITTSKSFYGATVSLGNKTKAWTAQKARNAGLRAKGAAKEAAIRPATALQRTPTMQKWAKDAQTAGAGRGFFGRLATSPKRMAGRLIEKTGTAQTDSLLKDAEARFGKASAKELAKQVPFMNSLTDQIAALKKIEKENKLGDVPKEFWERLIGDAKAKANFERFGNKDLYEKIEKNAGYNSEMMQKRREVDAAVGEEEKAGKKKELQNATDAFVGTFSDADSKKFNAKMFLDDKFGDQFMTAFIDQFGSSMPKIAAKLKGDDRIKFEDKYEDHVEQFSKNMRVEVNDFINVGVVQGHPNLNITREDLDKISELQKRGDNAGQLKWVKAKLGNQRIEELDKKLRELEKKEQRHTAALNARRKVLGRQFEDEKEEKKEETKKEAT